MKIPFYFLLLLFTFSACTGSDFARVSNAEGDAADPEAGAGVEEDVEESLGAQGLGKDLKRSLYQFDVVFNYADQSIDVSQEIYFQNNSADSLTELVLLVDAIRHGATFSLESLNLIDGEQISDYSFSDSLLNVPLSKALEPGGQIALSLHYKLSLPNLAGPLGVSNRQSNFSDWYPYVPPRTEESGWLVHAPAKVGEHLVYDSADFVVRIQLENAPNELQIAAPAPAAREGQTLVYQFKAARRFSWSASEHYNVVESVVQDVALSAYVFPEHRPAGLAALNLIGDALGIFQELFGPYPYESLAIVEAQFPDGLESDGLFFLSEAFFENYSEGRQNFLSTLSVHELAHNWWYGAVGNDQALEPWLDEALSIYSEALFYEMAHPDLLDWWWQFRVLDYSPEGTVASSIYEHDSFASYVHAVYFRGALFLNEMRQLMGEEAFFAFLRDYRDLGDNRILTGEDFFRLLIDYDIAALASDYFAE